MYMTSTDLWLWGLFSTLPYLITPPHLLFGLSLLLLIHIVICPLSYNFSFLLVNNGSLSAIRDRIARLQSPFLPKTRILFSVFTRWHHSPSRNNVFVLHTVTFFSTISYRFSPVRKRLSVPKSNLGRYCRKSTLSPGHRISSILHNDIRLLEI